MLWPPCLEVPTVLHCRAAPRRIVARIPLAACSYVLPHRQWCIHSLILYASHHRVRIHSAIENDAQRATVARKYFIVTSKPIRILVREEERNSFDNMRNGNDTKKECIFMQCFQQNRRGEYVLIDGAFQKIK